MFCFRLQVLESELNVPAEDILILSVQPASDTIISPERRKRETQSDLDVLLAVRKGYDSFRKGNPLRRQVNSAAELIEDNLGIRIVRVSIIKCNLHDHCY